ncbi:MAG: 2,3-bisphosphoglycerate-independent phosphoglycerate mutase [Gammaproteobacteria bacterium]
MANTPHRPILLIILDGWGYNPQPDSNAITQANTPTFDKLWQEYPHTLIAASSCNVGLPQGQMGNSEVGHLNLGAGRIVYQDLSRITNAIDDGSFYENSVLTKAVDQAVANNKAVHVFGLLSNGGIHSHETHIHAMMKLAAKRGAKKLFMHAFLDGRDTPPKSAEQFITNLENVFAEIKVGKIISLVGRYYAMDRDKRWDRVQQAYDLFTLGKATHHAETAIDGLKLAYIAKETDEFVKPTSIHAKNEKPIVIEDGDTIIFMNYRADRAREITRAFTETDFKEFKRKKVVKLGCYATLAEYDQTFDLPIAFPPEKIVNALGEYLANNHLHQLRIAETEKYAHVTFFLSGGVEKPYEGEDRILIPSPKVATYDLQPEMSAPEITEKLVSAIESKKYDVIICNFANCDMVGHTGKLKAAIKAVKCIDKCLAKVVAALNTVGGETIITADHGNAELMFDPETGQPHTAHTCNPVPFIYVGRPAKITNTAGALCDIAPTMLYLLGLPQPKEMSGESLVEFS